MAKTLQLKFDANQDYQLEAVDSVVRIFEGLPKHAEAFALGGDINPNLPPYESLDEGWLTDNLHAVQEKNGIASSAMFLEVDEGIGLSGIFDESHRYPNFTVEMETGTGKTYVYLRTIYELRQRYGFSKFLIVVPSIAIYEGVIKNFEITRNHFRALYGNEPINLIQYDGSQLSKLRSYATSTFAEIMVITTDAFNRATNNIYKASEKLPGDRKPYQFVQETRPILILDEPQNMESERSKEALRTLKPLFALRYSATHRTSPNLVYRLTPFDAYRRNLVKKIQVSGVTMRDNFNQPFLALQSITGGKAITARVTTYVDDRGRVREADITLKHGDDLHAKTKRDEHKGYVVADINVGESFVLFENGLKLSLKDTVGPSRPEIFRVQIEETVRAHMAMQRALLDKRVKVLSLFFIDRVANYVDEKGLIKTLFDKAFNKLKQDEPFFKPLKPEQVRQAYFARARTKSGEEQDIDTDNRNAAEREAEKGAFELIMRDKERLLSFDEPACFIFAHSALKEGWDNPNVFQICTLNQTVSSIKKRQEIGRGLRLCVNQEGDRLVNDEDANILTVIANESYKTYATTLQSEYVADGDAAPPMLTDASRNKAERNDVIFKGADFNLLWQKLSRRVHYRISIDTSILIEACVQRLNAQTFPTPLLMVERGAFVQTEITVKLESVAAHKARIRVTIVDTAGQENTNVRNYQVHDDLARILGDVRLAGLLITSIVDARDGSTVTFGNGVKLDLQTSHTFSTADGAQIQQRVTVSPETKYPVFNLMDRAARETGLTRPTVNAIFRCMKDTKKEMIFKNPEGFAGVFITEIHNALADHIAENIEYVVEDGAEEHDLANLFPRQKTFPQKELIFGGEKSLYSQVQRDSGVEEQFVARLRDDGKVVFYFKFPPEFKVPLPRIIGNYNPDWGIARLHDKSKITLHFVRETKGNLNLAKLRFPNERRKIECAIKYFEAIGVDYRPITANVGDWWQPISELPRQQLLEIFGDDLPSYLWTGG